MTGALLHLWVVLAVLLMGIGAGCCLGTDP